MNSPWAGEERRSIPIHVLNHIDEKLAQHTERVEAAFAEHTMDEQNRYQAIQETIDQHRMDSERRHEELGRSINAFMERTADLHNDFVSAFPRDTLGKADFAGHRIDHEARIREAAENADFRKDIRKMLMAIAGTVIGSAAIGGFGIFIWWLRNGS